MDEIKMKPHDLELEEALLGGVLQENTIFDIIEPYVHLEDVWYTKRNWLLWKKMASMLKVGEVVDYITLNSSLSNDEKKVMDMYWITGLSKVNISSWNAEQYAKKLYEKHLLRTTIDITREVQSKAFENHTEVYDVLTDAHSTIGELIELRPTIGFDIDSVIDEAVEEMTTENRKMVKSGYFDIDSMSGGLTKGCLLYTSDAADE